MILKDDLNRIFTIDFPPQRIISLVPSITETLFDLGAGSKITGITDYCVHPKTLTQKTEKIGGPKTINTKKINQLNPDIIFASKEENNKETIKKLSENFPCFVFDIKNFNAALKMIKSLGEITNTEATANMLVSTIEKKFKNIRQIQPDLDFLYLVWKNPYIAAGTDTFINSVCEKMGLRNCLISRFGKYPRINENFEKLDFEILFLPSEPYFFKKNEKNKIKNIFPEKIILRVDGEMFSWFGSRLLKAADYLKYVIKQIKFKNNK